MFTNRVAFRSGIIPCETNPNTGQESLLGDNYHHYAEVTVGFNRPKTARRVCIECADNWHKDQKRYESVLFA